jgi:two-component system chemotaxis sensor kinase CheA
VKPPTDIPRKPGVGSKTPVIVTHPQQSGLTLGINRGTSELDLKDRLTDADNRSCDDERSIDSLTSRVPGEILGMSAVEIDEVVKEFLVESTENLDRLDKELIVLESQPDSAPVLASIFRTIHTIKGTCGFLGFSRLEAVTHAGENLLSKLRNGEIKGGREIFSALLSLVDVVRHILTHIEKTANEPPETHTELINTLNRLAKPSGLTVPAARPAIAPAAEQVAPPPAPRPVAPPSAPVPAVTPEPPAPMKAEVQTDPHPVAQAPQREAPQETRGGIADSSVRVDVNLLDRLMDLVGELVLARNQTLQFAASTDDPTFTATSQRLNIITTELQEGIMKTRMQPIDNILGKFPRIVRDLSHSCGKLVRLEVVGAETELDRTIIEAIKDPLTHIVRNSIDHGIERPEVRTAAHKPAEGRILLRAFHEGGQVNIEISDDGAGIQPERVRDRAIQRGLLSREEAYRLSERELINLIFLPGFSTAEKVTNVSGRGVGMDVVKTNIEKIGGTLDVHSRVGHGMMLKIKIPLTLAIIPALVISSAGERYAIPQVNLLELLCLDGGAADKGIESVFGAKMYRLRDTLLPLVELREVLADAERPAGARTEGDINIVVVQADGRQFGLVVDDISDTQEIVVKPLGHQLKGVSIFAGATILGDGQIALILDVVGLAQRADLLNEERERALQERDGDMSDSDEPKQTLLLFSPNSEGRMVIPLESVARLEEFPTAIIERAGGREVVQYRGEIMELLNVGELVPERRSPDRAPQTGPAEADIVPVVVFSCDGRSIGLIVHRILDIVEEAASIQRPAARRGVLGSAVIHGRITEFLDVQGIVRWAAGENGPKAANDVREGGVA